MTAALGTTEIYLSRIPTPYRIFTIRLAHNFRQFCIYRPTAAPVISLTEETPS
jgi:hypothetical protein